MGKAFESYRYNSYKASSFESLKIIDEFFEPLILGGDSYKSMTDFFLVVSFYRLICQTSPQRSNGGKCSNLGCMANSANCKATLFLLCVWNALLYDQLDRFLGLFPSIWVTSEQLTQF